METMLEERPEIVMDRATPLHIFILKVDNKSFNLSTPSYNLDMCDKKMCEWVENACSNYTTECIEVADMDTDILSLVKPKLRNSHYTAVLYSDTPLISKGTIDKILEYVMYKGLNVCKLPRGYFFDTEYLKSTDKIYGTQTVNISEQEFLVATNLVKFDEIRSIMQARINAYHMLNGVNIIEPKTVVIGGGVEIGQDVTIYPHTRISGESVVGDNVVIYDGSVIRDSIIMKNSSVSGSRLSKCILKENSVVDSFCDLKEVVVEDGGKVCSFNALEKMSVIAYHTVQSFTKGE